MFNLSELHLSGVTSHKIYTLVPMALQHYQRTQLCLSFYMISFMDSVKYFDQKITLSCQYLIAIFEGLFQNLRFDLEYIK